MMAHTHEKDTITMSQDRPYPPGFRKHKKTSSMLFTMLPAVVQSHLPQIPSIRNSVSEYGLANRHRAAPIDSRPNSAVPSTGFQTPDGEYTNALVLSNPNGMADEDNAGYSGESTSSDEDTITGYRRSNSKHQGIEMAETKSGIEWKFANQGSTSTSASTIHADKIQVSISSVSLSKNLRSYRKTPLMATQASHDSSIYMLSPIFYGLSQAT